MLGTTNSSGAGSNPAGHVHKTPARQKKSLGGVGSGRQTADHYASEQTTEYHSRQHSHPRYASGKGKGREKLLRRLPSHSARRELRSGDRMVHDNVASAERGMLLRLLDEEVIEQNVGIGGSVLTVCDQADISRLEL
jgi:hypothetical protein